MPLVSIITPTYNRSDLIGRAIKSVQAQTFQDWEHIIVDDASTDDTSAVVESFQSDDRRIMYVQHQVNRKGGAARNSGIKAATGEYLAFLDSDDEWYPEKLEKQLALFDSSELGDVGIVTCGLRERGVDGSERVKLPKRRGWVRDALLQFTSDGFLVHPGFILNRKVNEPNVLWDEKLPAYQDWDYLVSASEGRQLDYVAEPLVLRHVQDERVHSVKNVAAASEMVIEKYQEELASKPRLLQKYHLLSAHALFQNGDKRKSFAHVRAGIRANPKAFRHYHRLGLSALGLDPRLSVGAAIRRQLRKAIPVRS